MVAIIRKDQSKTDPMHIYTQRMRKALEIIDEYMSLSRRERDEFVMELAKDRESVEILRELSATRERERGQEVRKLKEEEDEKVLVPIRTHISWPETTEKIYHNLTDHIDAFLWAGGPSKSRGDNIKEARSEVKWGIWEIDCFLRIESAERFKQLNVGKVSSDELYRGSLRQMLRGSLSDKLDLY